MTILEVRVQHVVMPSGVESATLVRDGVVVEPVDRFLAHLTAIERSPNTVKAYAHDLRDFFAFLESRGLTWSEVSLEDLGRFVAWLRLPEEARDDEVVPLPWVEGKLSAASVNRKLSALASFYEFHQRHGVDVAELLTRWRPSGRGGSWRPFLAHLGSRPERHRTLGLRADRRAPRELSAEEMGELIEACARLRDRFLLSLLRGCGLRIGEALGLRHEDIDARRGVITIRRRLNVNRARAKTWSREVPADAALIRLYSDYLHEEYGDLDCDYVFVNLWGQPRGRPMSYPSVDRLTRRLQARTGIEFTPHLFRHSYATGLLRRGVAVETVQHLLGHASISTTIDTYSHLGIEDARRALVTAGALDAQRPTGSAS
ncbi:site-specific integrase [Nonomuraea sp. M3C6]|uniref:Site-specific integrase n=1 Tax=Nonomuraea marmarensis TaxID=3351344 RepID=A0ABW7AVU3_9ACTN